MAAFLNGCETPLCTLPVFNLSIPFRVRDALQDAGRDDLLAEFYDRAEQCRSGEELAQVARDYLATD